MQPTVHQAMTYGGDYGELRISLELIENCFRGGPAIFTARVFDGTARDVAALVRSEESVLER